MTNPFQQLVERRLWPVALLLVAALVAVPMLLKKDPEVTSVAPPTAAVGTTGASPTDALVAQADVTRVDKVRSVLGDRKDPFRPAQIDKLEKPEADKSSVIDAAKDAALQDVSQDAGGETAPTTGTDFPVATVTPEPQATYELYSLVASFGVAGEQLEKRVVERLTGLPGGNPAVLYLGLLEDHKTAAFIVDEDVTVEGDGKCDPSPQDCQTLTLKAGETEFFTRGDTTYQLDLEKIITKKTFDADKAQANREAVAEGGASALRRMGRAPSFKFSKKTGFLAKAKVAVKSGSAGGSFRGATVDSTG